MDKRSWQQLTTDLKSAVVTSSDKLHKISDVAANQTPISPCAQGIEVQTQILVMFITLKAVLVYLTI